MRVKDIMTPNPVVCTQNESLQDAAKKMLHHNCGEIPIVRSESNPELLGVITDRDITCRAVASGHDPANSRVGEFMTSPCLTVGPDADMEECCRILEQHQIRRVPVVNDRNECIGIVAQADIARYTDESKTAEVLKEVSQPR